MIVTCPGCSSKYRVRNESVPAEGARMRCPKCETLFLAKPPVDGSITVDDPSSMYQQLAPQGARGSTGSFPAVPQSGAMPAAVPPPPGVGMPQAGPITALFAAVNPGPLPSDGGPSAAPPAPTPAPSLAAAQGAPPALASAEAPRVRSIPASSPALREATAATGALKRAPQRPSRGGVATSFGALALGLVVFLSGALTWAWTSEALPLDGALMPVARSLFGAQGPAERPLDAELVRRAAIEATERKDLPSAIVGWRRVKGLGDEGDRRASEALAKLLVVLGEVP